MDDFEGFKTLVKKLTADVVKIARELDLELEIDDVPELLQPPDKTWKNEDKQKGGFLRQNLPLVKIIEITRV